MKVAATKYETAFLLVKEVTTLLKLVEIVCGMH